LNLSVSIGRVVSLQSLAETKSVLQFARSPRQLHSAIDVRLIAKMQTESDTLHPVALRAATSAGLSNRVFKSGDSRRADMQQPDS
jgi:hypothetical protein